ncbi:uncharacterized protein LOC115705452 [Cannabis sativa]|uniref:uncharacterized protein LOC115705452 n=1 Tax=Cannabis sativa TaxID=3483 RepID=UPI0029CA3E1D|nr:uncharacterized protein LOC115705452 [Cannabis sativa]
MGKEKNMLIHNKSEYYIQITTSNPYDEIIEEIWPGASKSIYFLTKPVLTFYFGGKYVFSFEEKLKNASQLIVETHNDGKLILKINNNNSNKIGKKNDKNPKKSQNNNKSDVSSWERLRNYMKKVWK